MRRYIIAVIGNSNIPQRDERYQIARRLGKELIANKYRILTGGLGGIMEAVSEGAKTALEYKEGDIIGVLPGFVPEDANNNVDIPIATGLGFARNIIVANSDAIIAIGGGAGTLSEMALAWELGRLMIAYRVDGWSGELADKKIDQRVRYPDIPEDRVYGVSSEKDVIDILRTQLKRYTKRTTGIRRRR